MIRYAAHDIPEQEHEPRRRVKFSARNRDNGLANMTEVHVLGHHQTGVTVTRIVRLPRGFGVPSVARRCRLAT